MFGPLANPGSFEPGCLHMWRHPFALICALFMHLTGSGAHPSRSFALLCLRYFALLPASGRVYNDRVWAYQKKSEETFLQTFGVLEEGCSGRGWFIFQCGNHKNHGNHEKHEMKS